MKKLSFKHTKIACYIGYITQATVNNFFPLLFVMFNQKYGISFDKIALLISINFGIQLFVDLISARFIDKIGYRQCIVSAHVFAFFGIIALAFLPDMLPDPYVGLLLAMAICAIGGGLTEVMISPIMEACPSDSKAGSMSLLHSFYCWGAMGVIAISTLLLAWFGMESWQYITLVWALIPLFNIFYFCVVPINKLTEKGEGMSFSELFKSKLFWIFCVLMVLAGAVEISIAQWASAFAESGLKVSKTLGDLLGPCAFAFLMGVSRVFHVKIDKKINLVTYLLICALGCVVGYLIASLVTIPAIALIGCGICGFSVGVMWPGTLSLASSKMPKGGVSMFAFYALAGDLGCTLGPAVVGFVSGIYGDQLSIGLLAATIFPIVLSVILLVFKFGKYPKKEDKKYV